MIKPKIALDIDGVLNPYLMSTDERERLGFVDVTYLVQYDYPVYVHQKYKRMVADILERIDIVWCTMWEDLADKTFGPLLDLPQLTYIDLPHCNGRGSDKVRDILNYFGPDDYFCWVDDDVDSVTAKRMARLRPNSHIVHVSPLKGLTNTDMYHIHSWIDQLPTIT